jgi:hypothetical protein
MNLRPAGVARSAYVRGSPADDEVVRAAGGVEKLHDAHVGHLVQLPEIADLERLDEDLVVPVRVVVRLQSRDERLLQRLADAVEVRRMLGLGVDAVAVFLREVDHLLRRRDPVQVVEGDVVGP